MAAPRGRLRAACRRAPIPANHGTGCSAPARAAVRLSAAAVRGAVCDALRMSRPAQARAAAIWAAVVVVAASILLAPVITVTGYGDAPDGATVTERVTSLVGLETNLWLWLVALAVGLLLVAGAARWRKRASAGS